ncbi:MAG: S26 family signal peptidase, partial [Planctomycetota bacterium]
MYLFRFLEKYSKIICVIYLVGAILSYLYFANHQDGRVALLWVIFIILAVVHLFETFARKWLRWYKKPYVNVGLSVLIVLLFFFIFTIPFQLYVIKTSSMRPTIFPENIVLVNKMAYRRQ